MVTVKSNMAGVEEREKKHRGQKPYLKQASMSHCVPIFMGLSHRDPNLYGIFSVLQMSQGERRHPWGKRAMSQVPSLGQGFFFPCVDLIAQTKANSNTTTLTSKTTEMCSWASFANEHTGDTELNSQSEIIYRYNFDYHMIPY